MKFSEAIEKFSNWRTFKVKDGTVKSYGIILRQFCIYMRNCEIEKITFEDIMSWFSLMGDLNYERNSFIPRAMALKKFFEFYIKLNYQVLNPDLIPVPRKTYRIPRVLDDETYEKLLNIIPKKTNDPRHIRNLAIINLLWDTGARNNEICSLNIDEIQINNRKAVIKTEKSQGVRPIREIFWTSETNSNIVRWLEKREDLSKKILFKEPEAVFISAFTSKVGERFTIKGVGEMLRRYSERAKIPPMKATNAHSFRHHRCHDIIKKGGSSADVMNIAGHSSINSGSVYQMMFDTELEKRFRKFVGE